MLGEAEVMPGLGPVPLLQQKSARYKYKMFRRWRLHRVSSSERGSRQSKEKDIEKGRYTRRDKRAVRRTHRQKVHRQTDSSQVPRATFYPIDVPDL